MEKGILLTGGGALIGSIDVFLSEYLNVSAIRANQPMSCVAIGTGIMLDLIRNLVITTDKSILATKSRTLFLKIETPSHWIN